MAGSRIASLVVATLLAAVAVPAAAQEPGLEGRTDIVLQDGFEGATWYEAWGRSEAPRNTEIVSGDAFRGDSVLRVHVPEGEHYGTSFGYGFEDMEGSEPDEAYFRYAIRLGPTWTTEGGGGGKLPGFGGTYGTAGWGGRPPDGTNGWSSRGLFWQPESGRATGATRVGYYVYHADMTGTYGDNWYWSGGSLGDGGVLEVGRWYQLETYVRMNTPGENDGVLRAWADGTMVFERTDVRFRDVESLRVEQVWFDIYYGGSWSAPADMYIDFDNAVIAWGYIGPVEDAPPADAGAGDPDAGSATGDSGTPTADAGGGDPGSATVDGGCGCRVGSRSAPARGLAAVLAVLLLAVRRLRRRRDRAPSG